MRYSVKEVGDKGLAVTLPLASDFLRSLLGEVGGDASRSQGKVDICIQKIDTDDLRGSEFWVSGTINADLKLPCARCLTLAAVALQIPLDMRFMPAPAEVETEKDDDQESDVMFHDGKALDLEPLLREQILLSLPIAPLCQEDCKGLCPVCGQDRNGSDCGHQQAERVLPFAVLAGWKSSDSLK